MAFTHCNECDWTQDDFWDFRMFKKYGRTFLNLGYNPISMFLEYVGMYWKPRIIEFDEWAAKEMGLKSRDVYSWQLLWYEFKRMLKKFRSQHWWTYESYKNSKKKCPKCGGRTVVD